MSSRTYKSGAQKRKLKADSERSDAKLPKIEHFFSKQLDSSTRLDKGVCEPPSASPKPTSNETDDISAISLPLPTLSQDPTASSSVVRNPTAEIQQHSNSDNARNFGSRELVNKAYPSDKANYPDDIIDSDTKRYIIGLSSCRPHGPFPKNEEKRSFSSEYYSFKLPTGQQILRTWLCYSPTHDKVYCEPCWLFADRNLPYKHQSWSRGINDWKGLSKKIKLHQESSIHLRACMDYDLWKRKGTVDDALEVERRRKTNIWKQILRRIIDVTLTLATNNLAFRGHREKLGELHCGNFLSIIHLLTKYDPVLKDILDKQECSITYLSPQIQNEIISLLSAEVEKEIINEIQAAPFYSIIMDTTQDIAKVDQLSTIFRYVTVNMDDKNQPQDIKIQESFLGFQEVKEQGAEGLASDIIKIIDSKGFSLNKCRGQGYDGAATMSGVYSGVQTRIKEKEPSAQYVHCAAHNLNLVLNDAASGVISEVKHFYDVVQKLYAFFGNSIKRWQMLVEAQHDKDMPTKDRINNVTLKKLCPTRWASRFDAIVALRYRFMDILKTLTKIILCSKKKDERDEAEEIRNQMQNFRFVVLIIFQTKILESINIQSKLLQKKDVDLGTANSLLKNAIAELSAYRDQFENVKENAKILALKWQIDPTFTHTGKSGRVTRRYIFDNDDVQFFDQERKFKISVFYANLDIVITQLKSRFEGLSAVVERFNVLTPNMLLESTDDELSHAANKLCEVYNQDLSPLFPHQIKCFRSAMRPLIAQQSSAMDLAKLLIIENNGVASCVPDVCTAFFIFLTLPVTVAGAERSFSKLKIIKNYLRSTMSESRLSGLALLSIEGERTRRLNVDAVIDKFADASVRRKSRFEQC